MPRSGDGARTRLRDAALALFVERGFDDATTADIASRAGVNHRTYFRHFADKREVLFTGENDLRDAMVAALRTQPEGAAPMVALLEAFVDSAHVLEDNRESGMARLRLIAVTPALQERDLAKGAILTASLAAALEERGMESRIARVAAATGWATFHEAATSWIAEPEQSLEAHLRTAFDILSGLQSS